jgi:RNA polymerase sigma-B factor
VILNRPVATTLAGRHRGKGIPMEDLEQVAMLALVRAVHQFDPGREQDFLTYAVPTIRGELRKHFRDYGWMVRPPRRVQEIQSAVITCRDSLARHSGQIPTVEEIAEALDEEVANVEEAFAAQGCFQPASLDRPLGDEGGATVAERLVDDGHEKAAAEARVMLTPALRSLPPRDREIVRMRFFEDCTQQEIADAIGVTQMQVSRLLRRILRDLQRAIAPPAA